MDLVIVSTGPGFVSRIRILTILALSVGVVSRIRILTILALSVGVVSRIRILTILALSVGVVLRTRILTILSLSVGVLRQCFGLVILLFCLCFDVCGCGRFTLFVRFPSDFVYFFYFFFTDVSTRLSVGVFLGAPPKTHISAEDRKVIGCMLSDKVASSTAAGYAGKGLPFWKQFLHTSRRWPVVWLQDDSIVGLQAPEQTEVTRTHLFILYAHYLKATGVDDVSIYFKALGHDLRIMGYGKVSKLLHSEIVMIGRRFGFRGTARQVAKAKGWKYAVSGEMLL